MTTTLIPALTTHVAPKKTFEIFAHFHDSSLFGDLSVKPSARGCKEIIVVTKYFMI